MTPKKRTTRASPATTPVLTRPMTDVHIKALIDQDIADALAERNAERSRNGDDSHEAVRHDIAYAMPWKTLKKMITDKYCPRGEIKKLETEIMFPKESDEIDKYVGGLPDMIYGSVKALKPKTMQEAIEFATEMMDKKILTIAECQAENKIKFDDTPRNNQNQQQPFKRNNVTRAYTAKPGKKKPYRGIKPLCPK
ncbi:hypothetical protein Tco_0656669 [Tanacetum coccineum]|uniref:Reverse transcriptase domain-containing protein n=1 Tax=Tanacetum coccineum TaxID=301880 RepID=A0ABQ4XAJ5_9ASTR